jgi:uncharacterized protein YndB with AHSA1/START domain
MNLEKTRISVSVVTVEIQSANGGTRLIFTEQGVFLDGHDSPVQREEGTNLLLDKLGDYLRNANETVHKRIIDAPREVVFNAWTTPKLLAQWWGPKGFTNTFQEFDLRPGGNWLFIMHAPNGKDFPNKCIIVEISSPKRMIISHVSPVHQFQIIADFEDLNGKTSLTFCQRFETVEELERIKSFVVPANEENLDRLVEVVRTLTNQE